VRSPKQLASLTELLAHKMTLRRTRRLRGAKQDIGRADNAVERTRVDIRKVTHNDTP
jgi:hypothetical protein